MQDTVKDHFSTQTLSPDYGMADDQVDKSL